MEFILNIGHGDGLDLFRKACKIYGADLPCIAKGCTIEQSDFMSLTHDTRGASREIVKKLADIVLLQQLIQVQYPHLADAIDSEIHRKLVKLKVDVAAEEEKQRAILAEEAIRKFRRKEK